ncbi:MAG: shikimate dehydrogenase [Promethearchaeota archaeon]|nr:MAG: shikimate dehydrogenase [Candidatus Lokiarchaeota archaeon]
MSRKEFITANTQVFCVIGYPIEHSMSSIMHNVAINELNLDCVYLAFKIHPKNLKFAVKGFRAFDIKGINVTMPFKQKIMVYLDEIEPLAQRIGAINTIKNDKGHLIGRNTDGEGALKSILDAGYSISGKNILLLGAGGGGRTLAFILAEYANKMVITNRTEKKAIKLANDIKKYYNINVEGKSNSFNVLKDESKGADILINTTPIGMYPNIEESPIPDKFLHDGLIVFDIVYNPLKTKLMKEAAKIGCKVLGGLDMLINQGVLAFEWWTGKTPNNQLMKAKIMEYLRLK